MNIAENFPDTRIPISSPDELAVILCLLREFVLAGKLHQFAPPDQLFAAVQLADIADSGPWPDFVGMHFRSASGTSYQLAVETFHGAGGEWVPLGA